MTQFDRLNAMKRMAAEGTLPQQIEFQVVGIQSIGSSDGEKSYSATVWGQRPHEFAYVEANDDWTSHGWLYGTTVKARLTGAGNTPEYPGIYEVM